MIDAKSIEEQRSKFGFEDTFQGKDIPGIINTLISSALALIGALFFVMFLYGGFTWMTAGGDSKKVESARKTLMNAAIGLIIVALSYAIVTNIIGLIATGSGGTTGTTETTTECISCPSGG
ncbi:MAG: pilin [Patescibacteria group bacterium]